MAKGGVRVGSGRKPLTGHVASLHGSRGNVAGRAPNWSSPSPLAPPEPVAMPTDLSAEQAAVWLELAPHALEARTLTAGTVQSFRDLCEAIVVRRAMLAQIDREGLIILVGEAADRKAHPLLAHHRGMMQRVEAGLTRFRLAPMGKEILAPIKAVDPFDEFDPPTKVQ